MSISTIKNKLVQNSKKDNTGWLEKAKWRQENQDWLDISFDISVYILATLRANKKEGVFPKNQKEFALLLDCTPQYVNKLLKGTEKLNIETISKIQKALGITIINLGTKALEIEIVAQQQEVYIKPKEKLVTTYQKLDNIIYCNFKTKKSKLYHNDILLANG